jgi:hypothetical protein
MKKLKSTNTKPAFRIFKLLILFSLFSASSIKAQCPTPEVLPFPAENLGQQLLIKPSSPLFAPTLENANNARQNMIEQLLDNPCVVPTSYPSCSGNVCCKTEYQRGMNGGWVYVTVCWSNNTVIHTSVLSH